MEQIKQTPEIHTAFNPVIIVGGKEVGETDAVLSIVFNDKTIVKKHEYFNNVAQFDISETLKKRFKDEIQVITAGVSFLDHFLFVKYHTEAIAENGWDIGERVAVNAVVQAGESSNLTTKRGTFLTGLDRILFYPGYERTIACLGFENSSVNFEQQTMCETNEPLFCIIIQPGKSYIGISNKPNYHVLKSNSGIPITNNRGEIITVLDVPNDYVEHRLSIKQSCIPQNPFYVKWVNQQGGIDYWMFSRRQLFKREVSNVEIFSPVVTDPETAKGFSQILGVDGIEKATVGAENITSNEYETISKLIYSPKIEWFNEKLQKWQTLIIDKGDNDNDTKATLKELDFTFKLPDPQLQF